MSRPIPTGKAPQPDVATKFKLGVYTDVNLMGRWPMTLAKTPWRQWYWQCASCPGICPAVDDQCVADKLRVKHSAKCPSLKAGKLLWRVIAIHIDLAVRIARAEGEQSPAAEHLNGAVRAIRGACELVREGQAEVAGVVLGPQVLRDFCQVLPALERLLLEAGLQLTDLGQVPGVAR